MRKNMKWIAAFACFLIVTNTVLAAENQYVPNGLREAIIAEAIKNGADDDFDIPAVEDYLDTLESTGDLTDKELAELLKLAPKNSLQLPLVIALRKVNADLVKADRDLVKADRDLVKADRDLVKADQDLVKADQDLVKMKRALEAITKAVQALGRSKRIQKN